MDLETVNGTPGYVLKAYVWQPDDNPVAAGTVVRTTKMFHWVQFKEGNRPIRYDRAAVFATRAAALRACIVGLHETEARAQQRVDRVRAEREAAERFLAETEAAQ